MTIRTGSPPRVWGKRRRCGSRPWPPRFTPTRVGKTCNADLEHDARTVHPHACGENNDFCHSIAATVGSPPRVWGKPHSQTLVRCATRFTPTRVGKTVRAGCPSAPGPVHPHACGENAGVAVVSGLCVGSPPRVWGKPDETLVALDVLRFTPTRVGKTRARVGPRLQSPVHPHACGENSRNALMLASNDGSPPRVWGKLCHCAR